MSSRVIAVVALLVLSVATCAQDTVIDPGDSVKITVLGSPDLGAQTTVDDNGSISLPLIGAYKIGGKTISHASADIRQLLLQYVKDPKVGVEVTAKSKRQAVIAGRVKKAGAYPITPKTTLMEILALAGGAETNADLARVQLIRGAQATPRVLDLQAFTDGANPAGNPSLEDGDVVVVPERVTSLGTIFVLGEVRKTGACEIWQGMRAHEAIAVAGGLTDMADTENATLRHNGGDETKLDLKKAMAQDPAEDTMLAPGDTIYVPTVSGTFNIYGALNRPGVYPIKGKMMLTDAVAAAQGYTNRARLQEVKILRPGDPKGITVNMDNIVNKTAENMAVLPGDTVVIPERKSKGIWQALGAIASLGWLFW